MELLKMLEKERLALQDECAKGLDGVENNLMNWLIGDGESWVTDEAIIDDYGSVAAAVRHFIDAALQDGKYLGEVLEQAGYDNSEDEDMGVAAVDAAESYFEGLYKILSPESEK